MRVNWTNCILLSSTDEEPRLENRSIICTPKPSSRCTNHDHGSIDYLTRLCLLVMEDHVKWATRRVRYSLGNVWEHLCARINCTAAHWMRRSDHFGLARLWDFWKIAFLGDLICYVLINIATVDIMYSVTLWYQRPRKPSFSIYGAILGNVPEHKPTDNLAWSLAPGDKLWVF